MGYCMSQIDGKFFINKGNKEKALKAIKELSNKHGDFAWVSKDKIKDATTLEEALMEWGYETDVDDNGNIVSVCFSSEKLGDDAQMWDVVAPFVKSGSYIEMQGEDGTVWRWIFKKGEMTEKTARFVYE